MSTVEYDPNRTARIALVTYADGEKRYILHPLGLKVGDQVISGENVDILPGNCLPLKNIPLGTMIHNVELKKGKGGQIARSAGSAVQLVAKEGYFASVKMPSGEIRLINIECLATVGQVGNLDHENVTIGKAGRNRWLGPAAARSRRRDESGRSSARRRRRQELGRTAPGVAVGPADEGIQDAPPQEHEPVHRGEAEEVKA